jgi:hypothetical protein
MAQYAMTCILCFLRFLLFQDETYTMHPNFAKADRPSGEVIGAAILVHRIMGPGLLESIDERCLLRELARRSRSQPGRSRHRLQGHRVQGDVEGISRLILPAANKP